MSSTAGIVSARTTSALLVVAALAAGGCSEDSRTARSSGATRTGTLERVTDGDTIRLVEVGRVRLIGVDTPEVFGGAECFGREASKFLKRLLRPGMRLRYRLGVDARDRYGRALAYVWLPGGRMLNAVLVERGYATPLTIAPNVEYADRFVAAARRAREAGRGLWNPRTCDGVNARDR